MKQGKRPTRKQKDFIALKGLIPEHWYVERDTPEIIVIVSKKGYMRTYRKGAEQ